MGRRKQKQRRERAPRARRRQVGSGGFAVARDLEKDAPLRVSLSVLLDANARTTTTRDLRRKRKKKEFSRTPIPVRDTVRNFGGEKSEHAPRLRSPRRFPFVEYPLYIEASARDTKKNTRSGPKSSSRNTHTRTTCGASRCTATCPA